MKFGTKVEIFSQDTTNQGQGNNNGNEHDVNQSRKSAIKTGNKCLRGREQESLHSSTSKLSVRD
jgi:hypothetical protein